MTKDLFNWLGLIVGLAIVGVLARRPQVVSSFFNGASNLVGTAIGK